MIVHDYVGGIVHSISRLRVARAVRNIGGGLRRAAGKVT